ncbi:NADH-ubiquinone oxidoreductase B12 subunit family-domain-containing protein [Aspergillus welwitschiae]|uniref:NADH-ubiquinone oxidoreductase B12 subunit family-domain-containing protein n=1 Tax=Aspergillus welwitschiae TaxID=1341132 RepID=A0A3F3Q7H1_9EURO|nr:NADH-ubiquinone oxidoreductase B12 subunit family-domain-containing protein [Aspergillus welwitschiae]RDH35103.1 NADH-ubiquinone oxidoreductase B12 subunit family-domain-containing protein [Aspergillus welwitschiae]
MAPNPTGFDINEFKAAAHPRSAWAKKDPWARYEAWRYTGPFSRFNRFKRIFPGFGIASVAFASYCAYEHFFLKDDHHHHGEGHH